MTFICEICHKNFEICALSYHNFDRDFPTRIKADETLVGNSAARDISIFYRQLREANQLNHLWLKLRLSGV